MIRVQGKYGFSRIIAGYSQGYTAALKDVLDTINYIDNDLTKHRRRRNRKTYAAIVQCMIDNRELLRENPYAFVRCNDKCEGGFEVYCNKDR